ncbi:hypothetical protein SESBI_08690 [Sesbania bispinosa]|nr:hypothetical protein SESBI_08690 [Sesbania bispinosa]
MSSEDFGSEVVPDETNSSSSFSALLSDNPPQAENLIPVINVEDSEEAESDLDSQAKENRNTPVYQTFLTEVYTHNLIYTSPASIAKFLKLPIGDEVGWVFLNSIPYKGVLSAYTSSYKKWEQKCFRIRGVGAMSTLLVSEDGTPHFPLFWSLEPRRVTGFDYNYLPFDEKIDVAFLRNSAPLDCGFLLENEDLSDRLRQILGHEALAKEAGREPDGQGAGGNANQPAVSTSERRKKQKLDGQGETQSMPKTTQEGPTKMAIQNVPPQQPTPKPTPTSTQAGAHTSSGTQAKEGLETVVGEKSKACEDLLAVSEQKAQLESISKLCKQEIAIQHAWGFRKAIDQVKILNPTSNVGEGLSFQEDCGWKDCG